jgi:hypothetical protein
MEHLMTPIFLYVLHSTPFDMPSKNYILMTTQFSIQFLCLISTNRESNYVKFVKHNLRDLDLHEVC